MTSGGLPLWPVLPELVVFGKTGVSSRTIQLAYSRRNRAVFLFWTGPPGASAKFQVARPGSDLKRIKSFRVAIASLKL